MTNRSVWLPKLLRFWGVAPAVGLIVAMAMLSAPRTAQTHPPCDTGGAYYGTPQVYGPAGVRGQARRVSRRTSRRGSYYRN